MARFALPPLAAAPDATLRILLISGLVCLSLGLAVLMWTRWGQARPLTKCAGLSLLAHVLLLACAYSTRVLYGPAGDPDSEVIQVRLLHTDDSEDASPLVDPAANPDAFQPWAEETSDDGPFVAMPAPVDEQSAEPEESPADLAASTAPPLLEPSADKPPEPQTPPTEEIAAAEPPVNEPHETEPPPVEPSNESIAPPADAAPAEPAELLATDEPPLLPPPGENLANLGPLPSPAASASPYGPPLPARAISPDFVSNSPPRTLPQRAGDGAAVPQLLAARVAADRLKIAEQNGGNASTEAAVAAALAWLAANQSPDGRWDADAFGAGRETAYLGHNRGGAGARGDTGITGLALLALLGNGHTHLEGRYRENVQRGLEFLLASQVASGSLAGEAELFASMYCHGIASLALSEAYAMTGDPRLKDGVWAAVRYTLHAQHVAGGWRYQPGDPGDMSQFGWQLMVLKSAELGGLPVPAESQTRAVRFLRSVSAGRLRGLACYRAGERPSRTMTAEAMYCRSLLNIDNGPAPMDEGARFVLEELPGSGQTNVYYWYYGTLAMFQRHGDDWNRWNRALQHELLGTQRQTGEVAGSWDPDTNWGSYGGRVYSTSMSALCLEVYYRYLPLYDGQLVDPDRWAKRPNSRVIPR